MPELVIVGPEGLLADGVADRCAASGIPCFGPTAELAQLETSKGFTRSLAERLGIPSPAFARHTSAAEALAWWRANGSTAMVVKLDGLAAGKGVIVPSSAAETEAAITELGASGPIVLEELLRGAECSLLALCDGKVARPLPLAQDHKRIGEGDTGPNTGGMGAYAPAPVSYEADELCKTFVQPVVDHFAALGTPYVGVLYAGLILTADGPRLLEFNCRFGDPEAQAVLPLLDSDLVALTLACTRGRLADRAITTRPGVACTVVAAAPGYPGTPTAGAPITVDGAPADLTVDPRPRPDCRTRCRSGVRARQCWSIRPGWPRTGRSPGDGCCRSPPSAPTSARRASAPTRRWRGSTSTGCRCAATSAGGHPGPRCRATPRPASTSTRATAPCRR